MPPVGGAGSAVVDRLVRVVAGLDRSVGRVGLVGVLGALGRALGPLSTGPASSSSGPIAIGPSSRSTETRPEPGRLELVPERVGVADEDDRGLLEPDVLARDALRRPRP